MIMITPTSCDMYVHIRRKTPNCIYNHYWITDKLSFNTTIYSCYCINDDLHKITSALKLGLRCVWKCCVCCDYSAANAFQIARESVQAHRELLMKKRSNSYREEYWFVEKILTVWKCWKIPVNTWSVHVTTCTHNNCLHCCSNFQINEMLAPNST